ncbi:MAG: hypothetical protein JNL96_14410 [Planctomycetaceae bacterium]|nr:hypothetical protein [Planctomycetaceae bacterium]
MTRLGNREPSAPTDQDADTQDFKMEARPDMTGEQRMWEISFNKEPEKVFRQQATSAREAWALFCDRRKEWPSPHTATVRPARK